MQAGKLDTRIQVKRLTKTADGYGGFTSTKAVFKTIWAKKMDISGDIKSENSRRKIYTDIELIVRKKTAETILQNDLLSIVGDSDEYRIDQMFDSVHKRYTKIRAIKNG